RCVVNNTVMLTCVGRDCGDSDGDDRAEHGHQITLDFRGHDPRLSRRTNSCPALISHSSPITRARYLHRTSVSPLAVEVPGSVDPLSRDHPCPYPVLAHMR